MAFDIKGSTIGRRVKFTDYNKFWLENKYDCKGCLKDLNYIEINKSANKKLMKIPSVNLC